MNTIAENTMAAPATLQYDVIIAGAGPVGLFLACELALAKCTVLVLEQAEDPHSPLKRAPFGIRGLSAPTIEALYRRGLLQEPELHKRTKNAQQQGKDGVRRQGGHFAGIPFNDSNIDTTQWKYRLKGSTETSLMTEMEELETVLSRRANSLGVRIKRGISVSGFEQSEDEVSVAAGEQVYTTKWLVGCDGGRSTVRRMAGFEFAGTEPEFTGYSTLLDIADHEKLQAGRNVTAAGMYMQSQPGYVIIQDFDGGAFHGSGQTISREHVQEVLRRVSGTDVTINAVHLASTWTDRARQATAYRKGKILLAGDAAHIHAPLGGQGLNLGIGDAMNLGWKLAATIHNKAPEGLLDTYYTERYPIGEQVLDWSRAQVAIMKPGPTARALHAIFRDLIATRDGATYFAGRVWGINTHYQPGGGHPLCGHSVPNFELENGTMIGELMQDGMGILIDLDDSALLRKTASEYGDRIKYLQCRAIDLPGLKALLVRPDGIVAWVAGSETNEQMLRPAVIRWFGIAKPDFVAFVQA